MSFTSTGRVQSSLNSWVEKKNFPQCLTLLSERQTLEPWLRAFNGVNSGNCPELIVREGSNDFMWKSIRIF